MQTFKKKGNGKPLPDRSTVYRYRTPDGPADALDAAVSLLGPYPWKRCDPIVSKVSFFSGLPEIVTEPEIRKQVRRIGSHYLKDLRTDAAAIRVKNALEAFNEIAELADTLAGRLSALSEEERHFLTLFVAPGEDSETWREQIFYRLPPIFMEDNGNKLPAGPGVGWLRLVGEHTRAAMHSLGAHRKSGTGKTGDLGGNSNLNRLLKGSPGERLVSLSWQLFEWAPHCQPSGTAHSHLHQFMGYIHEWTTGENVIGTGKFESQMKAFAKPWKLRKSRVKQYQDLKKSLPEDLQSLLDAALSGYRPDLRKYFSDDVLAQGDRLRKELGNLI